MYLHVAAQNHGRKTWAGIPAVDDTLVCPNCGWKGHSSLLVVSGYDPDDFYNQVVSGETHMECPECRTHAGHMLHGWTNGAEVVYRQSDVLVASMAMSDIARSLSKDYQIAEPPVEFKRPNAKRRQQHKPAMQRKLSYSGFRKTERDDCRQGNLFAGAV